MGKSIALRDNNRSIILFFFYLLFDLQIGLRVGTLTILFRFGCLPSNLHFMAIQFSFV